MKLYFKSAFFVVALSSLFLTSCLKDDDYDDRSIQSTRPAGGDLQKVVGLSLTATATTNFQQVSLKLKNFDTTFGLVPVTIASNAASEDVRVVVVLNPALIGEYNANNGAAKEEMPTSVYTITSPAATGGGYLVTIPKGSNTGFLQIKLNPSKFLGHDYALGVEISKVENGGSYRVGTNVSTGVVGVGIKNDYDGEYELSGTLVDLLAPANSSVDGDPYPYNVYLITTGANTNTMFIPGQGYYHLIAGNSVYGEFDPVFTFDNATKRITAVTNYYGDPSPTRARSGGIDNSSGTASNKVNADKSIDLKYFLYQGGTLKATFNEHLKYVGERP